MFFLFQTLFNNCSFNKRPGITLRDQEKLVEMKQLYVLRRLKHIGEKSEMY